MEAFGIIGMTLGMTGMSFGVISWGLIASLKKELADLKRSLHDAGVLKEQAKSEGK